MTALPSSHSKSIAFLVWLAGAAFVLYQFMVQSSMSVMIPALESSLHTNTTQIGLLASSYYYTYILCQVPSGLALDRYGYRLILTISILCSALTALFFGLTHTLWSANIDRLLMGIVSAPAVAGALSIASRWFHDKHFPLLVGMTEMIGMLGGMFGELILGTTTEKWGYHVTMYILAGLGLLLGLCMLYLCRYKAPTPRTALPQTPPFFSLLKSVIGVPKVWWIGLYAAATFALVSVFPGLWATPFLQVKYTLSLSTAGNLSALIFLGLAIGNPTLGYLSERISPTLIMTTSVFCTAVLLVLLIYLPPLPMGILCILLFLQGFSISSYILAFSLTRHLVPGKSRATAMSFINMMSILLGPPILQPMVGHLLNTHMYSTSINGVLRNTTQSYHYAFIPLLAYTLLALLTIPIIAKR